MKTLEEPLFPVNQLIRNAHGWLGTIMAVEWIDSEYGDDGWFEYTVIWEDGFIGSYDTIGFDLSSWRAFNEETLDEIHGYDT